MGEMRRANSREAEQSTGTRYISTLAICASIIVAVRLAREDIGRPSPKILAAITDSVNLAKSLLEAVLRRYPSSRLS
jgi:hypothetical protein